MSLYWHLPAVLCFIVFFYFACIIAIHGSFEEISTFSLRITWTCFGFVVLWGCYLLRGFTSPDTPAFIWLVMFTGVICVINGLIGSRKTLVAFSKMLQEGHSDFEVANLSVEDKDLFEPKEDINLKQ